MIADDAKRQAETSRLLTGQEVSDAVRHVGAIIVRLDPHSLKMQPIQGHSRFGPKEDR